MVLRNLIVVSLIFVAVSFAQSADSTKKVTAQQPTTTIAVKTEDQKNNSLKKIVRPTTTWSKIKDLFM